MQFRRGQASRALLLPQRSLLVMAGESRLAWAHYIPSHKADCIGGQVVPRERRVSLTFRQVRRGSSRPLGGTTRAQQQPVSALGMPSAVTPVMRARRGPATRQERSPQNCQTFLTLGELAG